jgi:hypothetical protein
MKHHHEINQYAADPLKHCPIMAHHQAVCIWWSKQTYSKLQHYKGEKLEQQNLKSEHVYDCNMAPN